MTTLLEFLSFLNLSFIKGVPLCILIVIFAKMVFKQRVQAFISIQIVRWLMVLYSVGYIALIVLTGFDDNRASGIYWWAYWLTIIFNSVLPLFLISNKLGKRIYLLLTISVLMNAGWLFESFVIHITSIHRDYILFNPYLPRPEEKVVIISGVLLGVLSLMIENLIEFLKNRKSRGNGLA